MKDQDLLEVFPEIFPFVGSQNTEGEANQGPQVNHLIPSAIVLAEFVNLGVTIMTPRNTVCRTGFLYLSIF